MMLMSIALAYSTSMLYCTLASPQDGNFFRGTLMYLRLAAAQDHLQMLSPSCPQLTTLNNLNYAKFEEARFALENNTVCRI